jgi:hypothetical protein
MTLSRAFVRVKVARSDVALEGLPQIEGRDKAISADARPLAENIARSVGSVSTRTRPGG